MTRQPVNALLSRARAVPTTLLRVYAVLAAVLVAYLVTLVLRGGPTATLFDGPFTTGFELLMAALCFLRAVTRRSQRAVPLLLGGALLMWATGDGVLTAESVKGTPASPSLADLFYLSFYPLAYLVLVVLLRRTRGRLVAAEWLDGAVAGLGAA
ncbi:MAG: hypothetical protein JO257_16330, partial [Deltaproteobacteria bacterium]|nr:hypothetical protein [Deltaproteobacteria bacterium]